MTYPLPLAQPDSTRTSPEDDICACDRPAFVAGRHSSAVLDWIRALYTRTPDPLDVLSSLRAASEGLGAWTAKLCSLMVEANDPFLPEGQPSDGGASGEHARTLGLLREDLGPGALRDNELRARIPLELMLQLAKQEELLRAHKALCRMLSRSANGYDVWGVFRDVLVHPPDPADVLYRELTQRLEALAATRDKASQGARRAARSAMGRFLEARVRQFYARSPGIQPSAEDADGPAPSAAEWGTEAPLQTESLSRRDRGPCVHAVHTAPASKDVHEEPLSAATCAFLDFLVDEALRALIGSS